MGVSRADVKLALLIVAVIVGVVTLMWLIGFVSLWREARRDHRRGY